MCSSDLATGTTSTTLPQLRQRYRRHGTSSATGIASATSGPSICRTRKPCPCRRSPRPDGRLATPQQGQRPGRTSSTVGILDKHCLTSRALCTIRLLLRSFSSVGIYPGPDGDGVSAPVPITFSDPRSGRESGPLLQGRALHHARSPIPSHVDDGRSITVNAPSHHYVGSLNPGAAATKSPRYRPTIFWRKVENSCSSVIRRTRWLHLPRRPSQNG